MESSQDHAEMSDWGSLRPMPPTEHTPLSRRPSGPTFQPSFLLLLLYLIGFFFVTALLLILPELLKVLAEVAPGPEQQEIAQEVARKAARPKILPALAVSFVLTAVGAYLEVLPGFRKRG
jgi:hypothetical protein